MGGPGLSVRAVLQYAGAGVWVVLAAVVLRVFALSYAAGAAMSCPADARIARHVVPVDMRAAPSYAFAHVDSGHTGP